MKGIFFLVFLSLSMINCTIITTFENDVTIFYEDETKIGKLDNVINKVSIGSNTPFFFKIKSNPTTGYQWQIQSKLDQGIIVNNNNKITGAFERPQAKPGMVGVPGHQVFSFLSKDLGDDTIEFVYMRSWEKTPKIHYTLHVAVTG